MIKSQHEAKRKTVFLKPEADSPSRVGETTAYQSARGAESSVGKSADHGSLVAKKGSRVFER